MTDYERAGPHLRGPYSSIDAAWISYFTATRAAVREACDFAHPDMLGGAWRDMQVRLALKWQEEARTARRYLKMMEAWDG